MSISHGGYCKNQLSCGLNEVATWLTSERDFGLIFGRFGKENQLKMKMDNNLDWRSFGEPLGDRFFRMSATKCKVLRRVKRQAGRKGEVFGGFWKPLGEVSRDILVSLLIVFAMDFYMLLKWFWMDFDTLLRSKNEHFAWRVLQKSNFRVVWTKLKLDWHQRWIFDWFLVIWETFWEGKSIKNEHR